LKIVRAGNSLRNNGIYAFGPFQLDAVERVLQRAGQPVPITPKALEVLLALVKRQGHVVQKEDLMREVWPGTFVEPNNLAFNISLLRKALGEDGAPPGYIETIPKRGYRFIANVTELPAGNGNLEAKIPSEATAPGLTGAGRPHASRLPVMPAVLVLVAALVIGAGIWMRGRSRAQTPELQVRQLTTNSAEDEVWHAIISPDGEYLAYADFSGIQVRLIATGESHLLPRPPALSPADAWFPSAWFPDGTRFLATSGHRTTEGQIPSTWIVSVIGGAAALVRENALVQSVSPDGSVIAFTTGSFLTVSRGEIIGPRHENGEIWVMGAHGENARRLVPGYDGTYFGSVRWSPDGKRIAYRRLRLATKTYAEYTLETRELTGGTPSILISNRQSYFYASFSANFGVAEDFCWMPDGRIIYAVREPPPKNRDRNLWQIAVDQKTGRPRGQPRRITNLVGFQMDSLSLTSDGKRLVFETYSVQSHVYVARFLPSGALETPTRLTLDQRYNNVNAWTPDSKAVIFVSDRTGGFSIYKQALDQNVPELIPTGPESVQMVRASPDRRWLLYTTLQNPQSPNQSDSIRLMRVPMAGGTPQLMLEMKTAQANFDCPRSPRTLCVIEEVGYDAKQCTFIGFDPATGAHHELFRIALPGGQEHYWTVSPDGSRLAMTGTDAQGGIEIRSLAGRIERTIQVKGWPTLGSIDWAANGKALFVCNQGLIASPSGPMGATLLRVDFQGHAQPVWETRTGRLTWGITSPDGKYLAIRGAATERNAWMIENF
jgi:DNA-binding winged helix-turn-helix (wHTH) protein/Tol biopolymer transport system component